MRRKARQRGELVHDGGKARSGLPRLKIELIIIYPTATLLVSSQSEHANCVQAHSDRNRGNLVGLLRCISLGIGSNISM